MSALGRLYRGETNINFIGNRRKWYVASAVLVLICVASMAFKGFHWGVEFAGGTQFIVPVQAGTSEEAITDAVEGAGVTVTSIQTVGLFAGEGATWHEGSWWPDWQGWLVRDGIEQVKARIPGKGKLKAIEPAPGSYVRNRS